MTSEQNPPPAATFESRLIPIVREGVEIVQLLLFQELRSQLARRHPALAERDRDLLNGALINRLFGMDNRREPLAGFIATRGGLIEEEIRDLARNLDRLRIPLTDALRMQCLCDLMEGMPATTALDEADRIGLLIRDRDLPLPDRFIELVRRLGAAGGLLQPPAAGGRKPE
ncbi:MAG: hypothetical protein AB1568_03790 [Thermodesulfobacteriota bacterium]